MQPTSIPDRRIWDGAERRTFGAPRGMEDTVRPVEVLVDASPIGPAVHLLVKLEPDDLAQLGNDPHFWLTIFGGGLPPFSLTVPTPEP
jgi:hypothetical protein